MNQRFHGLTHNLVPQPQPLKSPPQPPQAGTQPSVQGDKPTVTNPARHNQEPRHTPLEPRTGTAEPYSDATDPQRSQRPEHTSTTQHPEDVFTTMPTPDQAQALEGGQLGGGVKLSRTYAAAAALPPAA